MLSSINTSLSSMVANRLRDTLPEIVNKEQAGFISGRFVGENSRMVF